MILTDQPGAKSWPIAGATFILMLQAAEGSGGHQRSAQVLRLGLQERRQDGRGASTTSRCPTASSKLIEAHWKSEIKGTDGKPVY